MKAKRFLLFVMAICLASGVKAQFYDSADDIYYYVEYKDGNFVENGRVMIFNFDGRKACRLGATNILTVKSNLKNDMDYYDRKVETSEYDYEYTNYSGTSYQVKDSEGSYFLSGKSIKSSLYLRYSFSSDRNMMYDNSYRIEKSTYSYLDYRTGEWITTPEKTKTEDLSGTKYKRVEKSFFKVGRSRTPSGTMHE